MAMYSSKNWTDEMLLDLIRHQDDRAAFAEIYNRYWDLLIDSAYKRLKSRELSEEIVQDVFVSLFIRRQKVQPKSTLESYLRTAVRNQVFRAYYARESHVMVLNDLIASNQIIPALPDELLEAKQLQQKIYLATDKLPEKCREVFVLSRFEHLSHQDIADRLQISVSTVKKHITKAMGILRTELGSHRMDLMAFLLFLGLHR